MKQYTVKIDVIYTFDVEANSLEEAVAKANHFQQTMKPGWGEGSEISWMDTEVVKEIVERQIVY
jgi:hypothetical protein